MVDYEKGTASWDIGMVMTIHAESCNRRAVLRRNAPINSGIPMPPDVRLKQALQTACTCGKGSDRPEERTSLRKEREANAPNLPAGG